jgi:hypothetical protein
MVHSSPFLSCSAMDLPSPAHQAHDSPVPEIQAPYVLHRDSIRAQKFPPGASMRCIWFMNYNAAEKPVRNNSQQNQPHCDKKLSPWDSAFRALLPATAQYEKLQQCASLLGATYLCFPSHCRGVPPEDT